MATPLSRRLLSVAAFVASFAAVTFLVRQWVQPPHEHFYRSKLEYFEEHKDEYNAVFLGSSLVFRSFIPEVIDARLAENGVDWRSFNLAVPAMRDFETDFMLRQVLSMRPANLEWIILELGTFRPQYGDNLRTYRGTYWHDTFQTQHVLRAIDLEHFDDPDEEAALRRDHLTVGAWRLLNIGLGPNLYSDLLHGIPPESFLAPERMDSGHGFVALDEGMPPGRLSPRIRQNLEEYEQLRESLPRKNERAMHSEGYPHGLLQEQIAAIEAAGVQVIYVLGPGIRPRGPQLAVAAEGRVPVLFSYLDPVKYPALYDVRHRFDPNHPNRRGAELTSELFARDLLEHVNREGGD